MIFTFQLFERKYVHSKLNKFRIKSFFQIFIVLGMYKFVGFRVSNLLMAKKRYTVTYDYIILSR